MSRRVTEADRSKTHWLYRLFDGDGSLLYVGQTRSPVTRFQMWESRARLFGTSHWFHAAVRIDWQQFPDFWSVIAAEKQAIESERPRFNRNHQPQRVA